MSAILAENTRMPRWIYSVGHTAPVPNMSGIQTLDVKKKEPGVMQLSRLHTTFLSLAGPTAT